VAEPCTLKALLVGREAGELEVPFEALYEGQPVTITTVLERTAVYERPGLDRRHLARLESLEVDAGSVSWRLIDGSGGHQHLKGARQSGNRQSARVRSTWNNARNKPNAEQTAAKRKRSDERARAGG
jgi:hypothetical protein